MRPFLIATAAASATAALVVVPALSILRADPVGVVSATAGRAWSAPELEPARERRPLPRVTAPTLVPPPAAITFARLRGRPALLEVWASWCQACRDGAPALARLAGRYGDRVQFVGIDVEDTRADGRAFVRRYRLGFPHIFDPRARLARRLGVFGTPTTFFVDARGRIAAVVVGTQPESRLARYLDLLAADFVPAAVPLRRGARSPSKPFR
jgi:cytochrome c biogenesis protein CcmG/thiol:disulfide interchange protein DsbE